MPHDPGAGFFTEPDSVTLNERHVLVNRIYPVAMLGRRRVQAPDEIRIVTKPARRDNHSASPQLGAICPNTGHAAILDQKPLNPDPQASFHARGAGTLAPVHPGRTPFAVSQPIFMVR